MTKPMIAALLVLAFVTACAPKPPIKVAVSQACVKAEDISPEPPHVKSDLTGNAEIDVAIVSASALDLRAWGLELYAQLKACAR